jgi:hypothetical protein
MVTLLKITTKRWSIIVSICSPRRFCAEFIEIKAVFAIYHSNIRNLSAISAANTMKFISENGSIKTVTEVPESGHNQDWEKI